MCLLLLLLLREVSKEVRQHTHRTQRVALERANDDIDTVARSIDRSELYVVDECFMTGTAAHVTSVLDIDRRPIGNGKTGEVTARLQKLYFDVIRCGNEKYAHWCTPV